ncbi:MAG TPA: hypothetical protein VEA37_05890, partial [Flavobacterium sp.]|nr:hypothetical protein [Flavobacterium sp.]
PAELIMVEWNPPADRPLLHEILPQPGPGDKLVIRYIIVPNEIHQTYHRGNVIPLYQMIAKNVGIRRAKGEFILCTNIDLLFSDKLFQILKQKNFDKNSFYRANRCDVPDEIELDWTFDKQLDFCRNKIIRRIGKNSKYLNIGDVPENLYQFPSIVWALDKSYALKKNLLENMQKSAMGRLDTNACGDFTMMSREMWEDIQGYAELDLYSIHIDTMAIIAAASLGYRQCIFPPQACAYHIDHPTGWEAMSVKERIKFLVERPGIGFDTVWDLAMEMLTKPSRLDINRPDWGWANEVFEEIVLTPRLVKQVL